jgi:hypothetical protein
MKEKAWQLIRRRSKRKRKNLYWNFKFQFWWISNDKENQKEKKINNEKKKEFSLFMTIRWNRIFIIISMQNIIFFSFTCMFKIYLHNQIRERKAKKMFSLHIQPYEWVILIEYLFMNALWWNNLNRTKQ